MRATALMMVMVAGCGSDEHAPRDGEVDAETAVEVEEVEIETETETLADGTGTETSSDGTGAEVEDIAPEVEVVAPEPAALPPWLHYCDATCEGREAVVLTVCPTAEPGCTPTRVTTIVPSVDGNVIDGVWFPVVLPEGTTLALVSGSAQVVAHLVTAYAPAIELRADVDVRVSYYELEPQWGGTTPLDFTSETRTSQLLTSTFYRHASYDTGTAAEDLHTQGQTAIADVRTIAGVTAEPTRAYFMPSELAGVSGEGNFSYGDGTVTSNYGNPPYIAALGGIMNVAFPRFVHECVHELFDEVRAKFAGNTTCLNEGLADALAFVSGHLPAGDFGPIGLRGDDFAAGCAPLSEVHDVGNCPLWHVRLAGLLDADFMRGVFQTARTFDFDSCALGDTRTGDSLLVLFTEAAGGADLASLLSDAGIVHSGSYAAALTALGFE